MTLPNGYKRLDYIQSSGTQWIDLDISMSNDFEITIKSKWVSQSSTTYLYGGRNGSNSAMVRQLTGGTVYLYAGTSYANMSFDSNLVEYKTIINGTNAKLYVDDVQKISFTYSGSIPTDKLCLMTCRKDGEILSEIGKHTIYYVSIRKGTTKYLLYPSMRESDSSIGLYDVVNNQFYENSGTGTFTYGHILEENITLTDNPLEFTLEDDLEITANFKNLGGRKYLIGV